MSYHQMTATSLTPTRPAPQAPQRRDTDQASYYTSSSTLVSNGYKTSFAFSQPSPSAAVSSYATSYSGIGASPIRPNSNPSPGDIVRTGWASVKEDAFASLFWVRKWMVLKEQALTFHKNEVRDTPICFLLFQLTVICIKGCSTTKSHQTSGCIKCRACGYEAVLSRSRNDG